MATTTYNCFYVSADLDDHDPDSFGQTLAQRLETRCNELQKLGYHVISMNPTTHPVEGGGAVTSGFIITAILGS